MEEVWKDIDFIVEEDGTCAYQVSNLGNVRRAKEVISTVGVNGLGSAGWVGTYHRRLKPKMLKTTNLMRGKYKGFTSVSIKDITYPVHRLVARVFLSDTYKPDLTVNHKDGNRFNNNIDNLEWVTQSENELHSYKVLGKRVWNKGTKGLMPKTWTANRKCRYEEKYRQITEDSKLGMSKQELASKYNLSCERIREILRSTKND